MTETPAAVRRASAVLAALVAAGVLLQSLFAGGFLRAFYGAPELGASLTWHEVGANATFGLLLVEGLLVVATPLRRDRTLVGSGALLGVLLTAVIGLGYVGGGSVAVHVPLAVLSFGAASWHAAAAAGLRLTSGSTGAGER